MKTILECVVGSTVHGTHADDGLEDLDLMRIVLEDMPQVVGFQQQDTWIQRTKPEGVRSEAGDTDLAIYGLRKFLGLALKGNPSILLALFVPQSFVREMSEEGEELQDLAPYIASKKCFAPFRGYMHKQHERLLGLRGQRNVTRPELVAKYGFDTKYAAHVVRLGMQGEEMLLTGALSLPMQPAQRTTVRGIRNGLYSLGHVSEMIAMHEDKLVEAYDKSTLPDEPDQKYVEEWMITKYMEYWSTQT